MKQHQISVVLIAAFLLLGSGLSSAAENKTDTSQLAATKADVGPNDAKSVSTVKRKHVARAKLVDINTATKLELKRLPGISDEEADKIIAGRPFGSKAWLVTRNIIPKDTYQAISGKIICKLTKKDIDKIEAEAANKSKQK